MDAPFNPTPSCWGQSSRAWPVGTNIDPLGDGTGLWQAGRSWHSASQSRSPQGFCSSLCCSSWRGPDPRDRSSSSCATILPAVLWYTWSSYLLALGEGSRASADNRSIWLRHFGPFALLEPETLRLVSWCLLMRAFTPLGAGMAVVGMSIRPAKNGRRDGLWMVWGISAMVAMAFMSRKLHHEYYWLLIAPVVAVGIGRAVVLVAENRRVSAALLSAAMVVLSWAQVRSTWRTPLEWIGLEPAAGAVRTTVPSDAWVVAPEALLFQSDRRGCRLEYTRAAAARAAGEWGNKSPAEGPLELIETYRLQGARYFADLGGRADDALRKDLHDFIRQRYKVIVDRPEVIIADLADSEIALECQLRFSRSPSLIFSRGNRNAVGSRC